MPKPDGGDTTYRPRALTDTETRYSELEKDAKAIEWNVLAKQSYFFSLIDTFEIDIDRKPLSVPVCQPQGHLPAQDWTNVSSPAGIWLQNQLHSRKESKWRSQWSRLHLQTPEATHDTRLQGRPQNSVDRHWRRGTALEGHQGGCASGIARRSLVEWAARGNT